MKLNASFAKPRQFYHWSSIWLGNIGTFRAQKFTQEKSAIFTKISSNTQALYIIFYTKLFQYFHYAYCIQEESMHSNLKVPMHFGVEVWGKFGIENHKQKVSNIRKSFLSYTTYLWKVFYAKLSRNSPFTYYLHTQTTYYFINPIFCHDLPSTHSFLTWLIPLALT